MEHTPLRKALESAPRGLRCKAMLVDLLIAAAAFGIGGGLASLRFSGDCRGYVCPGPIVIALVEAACVLVVLIVQVVFIAKRGQSLGMRMFGIRVLRLDGSAVGFLSGVLKRYWALPLMLAMISGPVALVLAAVLEHMDAATIKSLGLTRWLLSTVKDCIVAGAALHFLFANALGYFRADKRSLHDWIAGTVVTLAEKRAAASGAESNESGSARTRE